MNTSKLADISEIVSSIAIVATLIYLTIQVQQNTEALHAQSRLAIFSGLQEHIFKLMEYPRISMLMSSSDEMTSTEKVQMNLFMISNFRRSHFAWQQYQNGILDEIKWKDQIRTISLLLGTQRNRDWWKGPGRMTYGGDFVTFVDGIAAKNQDHEYWEQVRNLE